MAVAVPAAASATLIVVRCLRGLGPVAAGSGPRLDRLAAAGAARVRVRLVAPHVLAVVGVGASGALGPVVSGRSVPAGHGEPHLGQRTVGGVLHRGGKRAGVGQPGAAEHEPGEEGSADPQLGEPVDPGRDAGHGVEVAGRDAGVDPVSGQAPEALDERIMFVHILYSVSGSSGDTVAAN